MAITYVGGVSGQRAGAASTTTQSLSGTLTGGLAASPAAGDFVLVTCVVGSQARNPAQAISGWTALGQLNPTAQTYDTSMNVSHKFMGHAPDTSITIPSTGNNQDAQAWTVQVFRGVDQANPLDVTPTSTSGTGTTRADPTSITPSTAGAWVVVCSGGAAATASNFTYGSLTNVLTNAGADTNDAVVGSGYYSSWSSGAYDPAATTTGDATGTSSWASYTLALRPAASITTLTEDCTGTIDGAKWSTSQTNGTVAFSGGALDLMLTTAVASNNAIFSSVKAFNFIGGEFVFKLVRPLRTSGDAAGVDTEVWVEQSPNGGDRIGWSFTTAGNLRAVKADDYAGTTLSDVTTALFSNLSTYTWFRIRESAGTVYWDTASSSASDPPVSGDWTNRYSTALSGLPLNATNTTATFLIWMNDAAAGVPTQSVQFDGINIATGAGSPTHETSGALTGPGVTLSGTSEHKAKHTTTGALAGVTVLAGTASSKTTRPSSGALVGTGRVIAGTASSKTTRPSSGALVGTGRVIAGTASSKTTRPSTGALVGSGSVVAGTAQHKARHVTIGALTGPGSTIAGSASRKVSHASSGALAGSGSALAGTSHHIKRHATSGVLAGPGSLVAGTAKRFRVHSSTAVLVAAGVLLSGASRRFRSHASSGALVGTGAVVAGTAQHKRKHTTAGALAGVPVLSGTVFHGGGTHSTSGALVGTGKILSGTATHIAHHTTTGALVGTGKTLTGSAARTRVHSTAGALVATGRVIAGTARRSRTHATTGTLAGVGKVLVGSASKSHLHTVSGVVHGPGPHLVGISIHGGPYHQAIGTLVGPGVILEGVAGRLTYGQLGLRPASENGDRPIREQGPRPSEIQSTDRPSMIQESIRPPKVQTTTRKNL